MLTLRPIYVGINVIVYQDARYLIEYVRDLRKFAKLSGALVCFLAL